MLREPISKKLREQILQRDHYTCYYCGASVRNLPSHIDHVVPVSWGGTNDPANLVTACPSCNLKKGATVLGAWSRDERRHLKAGGRPEPQGTREEMNLKRRTQKLPKELENLRKTELGLARKRQEIRQKQLDQEQKNGELIRDKRLLKHERELAKKKLQLEERMVDAQLRRLEKQSKRGGCCLFLLILMFSPLFVLIVASIA